jgi:glycosyltransferase involved in cell wall biosynthesis
VNSGKRVTLVHNQKDFELSEAYRQCAESLGAGYLAVRRLGRHNAISSMRVVNAVARNLKVWSAVRAAKDALAEGTGASVVVHFHDILNTTLVSGVIPGPKVWTNHTSQFYELSGARLMLGRILTRVDRVIAPSSELAALTKSKFQRSATFIPNGIDPADFPPRGPAKGSRDSSFNIFIPRRMVHKNGIDVAMEGLALLPRPTQAEKYVVLLPSSGVSPDYFDRVKSLAGKLPDWVQISMLGFLSPADMGEHYRSAHLALIPSRVEAVSISALESLAWGVPLVCSAVGGLQDAFEGVHEVSLIEPEEPRAVAEAIRVLEGLPRDELEARGAAGAAWVVANMSWARVAAAVEEIYSSI